MIFTCEKTLTIKKRKMHYYKKRKDKTMDQYKLSRYEQETIILFNEEESTARIETFNSRIIREVEKAQKNCPEIICEERREGYGCYILPKKLIKIHTPRIISEEEKAMRTEIVRNARKKRTKDR